MNSPFLLSFAFVIVAAAAAPAIGQDRAAPAPTPGMAASMPRDCSKSTMKRHDHGAERNTPTASKPVMAQPCGPATAASTADRPAQKKPVHDHAKIHKNQ